MLISLSTILHGTLYEKLSWAFRLYDLNGDGSITKTELGTVMVGIYELMGVMLKPHVRVCLWILVWPFRPVSYL